MSIRTRSSDFTPLAAAAYSAQNCPILKLPEDILSYIFKLGAELYKLLVNGLTELSWLHYGQEWWSNNYFFNTSFQEAVSQVCVQWRRVALDTAPLWASLNFSDTGMLGKPLMYLARSKNAPLDISIIPRVLDHTFGSRKDQQMQYRRKNLDLILNTLLPHLSRWRMFLFWTDNRLYLSDLTIKLGVANGAPNLKVLMLNANTPNSGEDDSPLQPFSREEHARDNCALFAGQMPELRVLDISRAIFSWELSNLFESRLTTLTLTQYEPEIGYHMSADELIYLLQDSPELHTLTLYQFRDWDEEAWQDAVITLPALTRLSISFINHTDVLTFMTNATLPKLQSLTLHGNTSRSIWPHNMYDLFKGLSKCPNLKGVTYLKLLRVSLWLSGHRAARTAARFCSKFKSLEMLDISSDVAGDDGFLKAWALPKSFPRVNTLVLRSCDDLLLRQLVEKSSRRPLAQVYLTDKKYAEVTADLITIQALEQKWGGPKVKYIDLAEP